MTLIEILRRKAKKPLEVEKKEEIKEEEIAYKPSVPFSPPTESLFLALYTPFIKDPYSFDWFIFRDYSEYLLDGCYVLNTFPVMDKDSIIQIFLTRFQPKTFEGYAKIVFFVGHICLNIPASYEDKIRELLSEN